MYQPINWDAIRALTRRWFEALLRSTAVEGAARGGIYYHRGSIEPSNPPPPPESQPEPFTPLERP